MAVVIIKILEEMATIYAMPKEITFIIPMPILVVKISLMLRINRHMVIQIMVVIIASSMIDLPIHLHPNNLFYLGSSNRMM